MPWQWEVAEGDIAINVTLATNDTAGLAENAVLDEFSTDVPRLRPNRDDPSRTSSHALSMIAWAGRSKCRRHLRHVSLVLRAVDGLFAAAGDAVAASGPPTRRLS